MYNNKSLLKFLTIPFWLSSIPTPTPILLRKLYISLKFKLYLHDMKESEGNNSMEEVAGRISTLEGKVSEHDRIFDMIREEIRGLREYIDGRISDTNARIDDLNVRLGDFKLDMDKKIDATNARIDETNKRIEGMDMRLNGRIEEMDKRLSGKMDSNFKWMLGIQIAMWITIISAILLH